MSENEKVKYKPSEMAAAIRAIAGGNNHGLYAFSIDGDGDLILHYEDGATPPDFRIDDDGNLIAHISGAELNIGQVAATINGVRALKLEAGDGLTGSMSDGVFTFGLEAGLSPEMRRNIFRGKNLGDHVTEEQLVAIQDGSFHGLFVGDYWTINEVTWRIADMDYFYRCGDTEFTKHHLVIVPDTSLYNAQMNTSNTTEGGYINSEMYKTNLANAKTTINAAFPGLVLTHKDCLVNAVTNGRPSAAAWVESTVELMNEIMVYGNSVFTPANDGTTVPTLYTTGKQQFALFMLNPKLVNIRVNYWLRDVVSASYFALVNYYGLARYNGASNSLGVRPYFCIGRNNNA